MNNIIKMHDINLCVNTISRILLQEILSYNSEIIECYCKVCINENSQKRALYEKVQVIVEYKIMEMKKEIEPILSK